MASSVSGSKISPQIPTDMLSKACQTKDITFVWMAIAKGARHDRQTLTWACLSGNVEIIDAVIKVGAQPDEETLPAACATKQLVVVKKALVQGAKPSPKAFEIARKIGDSDIVRALEEAAEKKAPPASRPDNMLSKACQMKDIDFVRLAISKGAKPDSQTLTCAFLSGNIDIVEAVIQIGAQPDGETLTAAVGTGQLAMVKKALSMGAKPSDKTAAVANQTGNSEIVKIIEGEASKTPAEVTSKEIVPVPMSPIKTPILPIISEIAFGKMQWKRFFGDVGVEPPLPTDIEKILSSSCPFWSDKKVHETHFLTLIPESVNGNQLTLDILDKMIRAPKEGTATKYGYYWDVLKKEYGTQTLGASHWVLMTKDVIPGSLNKSYSDQQLLLAKAGTAYAVPNILVATVAIFMAYFAKGEKLYGDITWIYTRCKEGLSYQSVVGGFSVEGLFINSCDRVPDVGLVGLAALRSFRH